ncbi:MAG TPA: methionyl-tRNA formyltransferase, partial [Chitinophagaceae bacterium]
KHAPKIFTETCKIDWTRPVDDIYNLIRGLSPYPGAFTQLQGKTLKIYGAKKEHAASTARSLEWQTDHKTWLKYTAADGYIYVTELQLEGKKKMTVEEFLRGYRFTS